MSNITGTSNNPSYISSCWNTIRKNKGKVAAGVAVAVGATAAVAVYTLNKNMNLLTAELAEKCNQLPSSSLAKGDCEISATKVVETCFLLNFSQCQNLKSDFNKNLNDWNSLKRELQEKCNEFAPSSPLDLRECENTAKKSLETCPFDTARQSLESCSFDTPKYLNLKADFEQYLKNWDKLTVKLLKICPQASNLEQIKLNEDCHLAAEKIARTCSNSPKIEDNCDQLQTDFVASTHKATQLLDSVRVINSVYDDFWHQEKYSIARDQLRENCLKLKSETDRYEFDWDTMNKESCINTLENNQKAKKIYDLFLETVKKNCLNLKFIKNDCRTLAIDKADACLAQTDKACDDATSELNAFLATAKYVDKALEDICSSPSNNGAYAYECKNKRFSVLLDLEVINWSSKLEKIDQFLEQFHETRPLYVQVDDECSKIPLENRNLCEHHGRHKINACLNNSTSFDCELLQNSYNSKYLVNDQEVPGWDFSKV